MRFAWLLAFGLACVSAVPPAAACSCSRPSIRSALEDAVLVADMRVLEVRPLDDALLPGQYLLYRVERIYKAPPTIAEGDVVWVYHQTCNSMGYEPSEVGGRLIWFMWMRRGQLVHHYCSTSLQSSAPTPHVLLESRSRWLARRR